MFLLIEDGSFVHGFDHIAHRESHASKHYWVVEVSTFVVVERADHVIEQSGNVTRRLLEQRRLAGDEIPGKSIFGKEILSDTIVLTWQPKKRRENGNISFWRIFVRHGYAKNLIGRFDLAAYLQ